MNYYETREFWNEIDLKPNNESDWEVIVKNDTITFYKNFDLYNKFHSPSEKQGTLKFVCNER